MVSLIATWCRFAYGSITNVVFEGMNEGARVARHCLHLYLTLCRVYVVFTWSQILTPMLPVALNVGQMHAMERLRVRGILLCAHESVMLIPVYTSAAITVLYCRQHFETWLNGFLSLQKKGINCLNPKRIAISGKIRVFCFDNTGTLTKDGDDLIGAIPS